MSKNQRFGIISFLLLLILAILVTTEPWRKWKRGAETSLANAPASISLMWDKLSHGYPQTPSPEPILSYTGFDLAYNEAQEQASWVAYVLTRSEIESGTWPRSDNFRPDTAIHSGSATLTDYRGSGYDRGHLAPAGDMKWSKEAMSESFLLSNMSPQAASFNRGIWRKLEEQVRQWAREKDSIYVITGPVLAGIDESIGSNQVGIPAYYFKVLVDLSPPDHSFIAFLLPNERSDRDLMDFAISVDSLESFTGYDFFAQAPDQSPVDWLEKELKVDSWK